MSGYFSDPESDPQSQQQRVYRIMMPQQTAGSFDPGQVIRIGGGAHPQSVGQTQVFRIGGGGAGGSAAGHYGHPEVIRIGPSGVSHPNVRILERKPSKQEINIVRAPGGGIQILDQSSSQGTQPRIIHGLSRSDSMQESPSAMRIGSGEDTHAGFFRIPGPQTSQTPISVSVVPSSGGNHTIHFGTAGSKSGYAEPRLASGGVAPQRFYMQPSSGSSDTNLPSPEGFEHHAPTPAPPSYPYAYHTIARSNSRPDDGGWSGTMSIPVNRVPGKAPLGEVGRRMSADNVLDTSFPGKRVTIIKPHAMEQQPQPVTTRLISDEGGAGSSRNEPQVYMFRMNSEDPSRKVPSSPQVMKIIQESRGPSTARSNTANIQEALNARQMSRANEKPQNDFEDVLNQRMKNFADRKQQYLFRHAPSTQQGPAVRQEYYVVNSPGPDQEQQEPWGSTQKEGPQRSTSIDRPPGKKIVRTTREEIRDIGGGRTQTIRHTKEELVSDDEEESGDNKADIQSPVATWKSSGSSSGSGSGSGTYSPGSTQMNSPSGSCDRNLFNKFRFQFGSIGNFGRAESREGSGKNARGRCYFEDFDDMVGRLRQIEQEAVPKTHLSVLQTCPHCQKGRSLHNFEVFLQCHIQWSAINIE